MKLRSIIILLTVTIVLSGAASSAAHATAGSGPLPPAARPDRQPPATLPDDSNAAQRLDPGTTPQALINKLPNVRPLSDLTQPSTVSTSAAVSATEFFVEDFEGDWTDPNNPFWLHQDLSGSDGGEYLWGQRNCAVFNGSFSAFTAGAGEKGVDRSCTSKYPKNARSDVQNGFLDLSPYKSGTLTVYFKGQSEGFSNQSCQATHDYFFYGMGPENSDNVRGRRHCGPFDDGFYFSTIDLSTLSFPVLGSDRVLFELFFYSDDDSLQGPGFSVDYALFALNRSAGPAPSGKVFIPVSRKYTPPAISNCPDIEPNSSKAQGQPITKFGVACIGTLPGGDADDFYAVDVGANRKLVVDLNNFGSNDYDIYLYDANSATPLTKGINDAGVPEHIEYTSSKAQRLYLQIVSRTQVSPFRYYLTVNR